ncbi:MAG TPA: hypothetical protein DCX06_10830 [Opitutae bacterium]|nr:hypothetical protein [Opitutae bacterium]
MIKQGTIVEWKWGNGTATGTVDETHHEQITRTINGNEVTRKGSKDNPAYVIKQEDGTTVLKLQSEVSRADTA